VIPTARRRALATLAALVAAGAVAAPARAQASLSDAEPTPQAVAAHAEFLAHAPAPPGEPAAVCVIDTGVTPIRDLEGQITERLAVGGGTLDDVLMDPNRIGTGHGTFVASAIASQVDGWGSAGLWPRARIVSVRVVPEQGGEALGEDYRAALDECAESSFGVKAVNLSLGSVSATTAELRRLEDRVKTMRAAGISVVAGAGNTGDGVTYPGRFPAAVTVAATEPDSALCPFSSRGPQVDVGALGCAPSLSLPDGREGRFAGTSFAAPLVSAALAALRSYAPDLSAARAENLVLASARGGSLDVSGAFRAAGLGALVDASTPAPAPAQPPWATDGLAPDTPGAPVTVAAPAEPSVPASRSATTPPVIAPHLPAPRLRRLSFRRGRLSVLLRGVPAGGKARFTVDGRAFVRTSGRLSLRVVRWRRITVLLEDAWGTRSKKLSQNPRR